MIPTTHPAPNPALEGRSLPAEQDRRRPLLEHLDEVRLRLLRALLWTAAGTAAAWGFAPRILDALIRPVGEVVFLSPVDPFLMHLRVALLGGVILSFPLLALETWGFFAQALTRRERRLSFGLLPLSAGLFLLGAVFGWKLLLPAALKILLGFGTSLLVPMLTVGHYVGFAGWLILGCGFLAQLPLGIMVLTWAGLLKPRTLLSQWRPALLGVLAVSAVLTPTPDVLTQLLVAVPLAGLYFLSVGISFWVSPRESA